MNAAMASTVLELAMPSRNTRSSVLPMKMYGLRRPQRLIGVVADRADGGLDDDRDDRAHEAEDEQRRRLHRLVAQALEQDPAAQDVVQADEHAATGRASRATAGRAGPWAASAWAARRRRPVRWCRPVRWLPRLTSRGPPGRDARDWRRRVTGATLRVQRRMPCAPWRVPSGPVRLSVQTSTSVVHIWADATDLRLRSPAYGGPMTADPRPEARPIAGHRLWIPRQHGAWAMLLLPLLLGVAASTPDPWQLVVGGHRPDRVPRVGHRADVVAEPPAARVPPAARGLRRHRRRPGRAAPPRVPAAGPRGDRGRADRDHRLPRRPARDPARPREQPGAGRPGAGAGAGDGLGVRDLGPGARHRLHVRRRRLPARLGPRGAERPAGAWQPGIRGTVRRVPRAARGAGVRCSCRSPTRSWRRASPSGRPRSRSPSGAWRPAPGPCDRSTSGSWRSSRRSRWSS